MGETRRFRPFAGTVIGPTGSAIAVIQGNGISSDKRHGCMSLWRTSGKRECPPMRESRNAMTLTGLIIFLVIGAVAGWLAGIIVKGGGFGLIGDIVVGVIGSLIGGWLFGLLGIAAGGLIGSIIAAVVGAIILIVIVRLIKRA